MKLEDKLFNSFFYPFLVSIFLCGLAVTGFIAICTNNHIDLKTYTNLINLEKKYSKINIDSANALITTTLLKLQASLNELILFYQNIANKILLSEKNYTFKSNYIKCILNLPDDYCNMDENKLNHMGIWLIDEIINDNNINEGNNNIAKNQLIALDLLIPNLDSALEATKTNTITYYFYFARNELFSSYPISKDCETDFYYTGSNFEYNPIKCLDDNGEFHEIYKMRCESYFLNMMKSKTSTFDNNYLSMKNKTIFVDNYYETLYNDKSGFTMCIEFEDPFTEGKGYVCTDVYSTDLMVALDNINSNIPGYFLVSNIGYNNIFYFPQKATNPKTSVENIFEWGIDYDLSEKYVFHEKIRKIFSSNYIEYINDNSINDEVFVNGKNSCEQYFYLNGRKLKYSIYPVILYNIYGKKEHIFSIIYVYINELLVNKFEASNSSIIIKIILEVILIFIFGSGLLYLIYLTFNILAKYIVIPIKNVNYMLKGINIGGKNRLIYLDFLRKKQDENLEKLEKMYLFEIQKNNNKNDLIDESNIDLISNNENGLNNKNDQDKSYLISKVSQKANNKKINLYSDLNKQYDEKSIYIQNEFSFFDFDEQNLQYRQFEIESLADSLMNLKDAIILTSDDREVENIIDYSHSGEIFRNFKIKEGEVICESNIGNLQDQLLKFDKAIYHLVLSLQDNQLQRFLKRNLNDELDENDSLLYRISNSFNKRKGKIRTNILAEKQQNNNKEEFSQKILGILINIRYCRLIDAYYKFFKNIQKLQKYNGDISGQYINTTFHNVKYYHKIIIQYIYFSYIKKDLIKIGESILAYIEFLIKFKFKTSANDRYFLKINSKNKFKYRKKQEFKKKIFNKIINWFNLFDDYFSYVKDNSSLAEEKSIVDTFFNSEINNNKINIENQSAFMFRIIIQKVDFLKAKFALSCQNYNDALFYFIRASCKKSIIIDGLIKKRSLKHIYKLLIIIRKKYESLNLKNLYAEKELKNFFKNKIGFSIKKSSSKKTKNIERNEQNSEKSILGDEIENIKTCIQNDINGFNIKQEKDIIILIDFNIYNKTDESKDSKNYKIDYFVEKVIFILNNYLSINDRFSVFIYDDQYRMICPLMYVNKIDKNNFAKDLIHYKINSFNKINEKNFCINLNEFNDIEFNLGGKIISEHSQDDSFEISDKNDNYNTKIDGLVKTINYINYYLRMKEDIKNEKYVILFTDSLNIQSIDDTENIEIIFNNLKEDKKVILILVGKINVEIHQKNDSSTINLEELILSKFNEKSEVINFENMKRIKTILSSNNFIKDEIVYPNEIYK